MRASRSCIARAFSFTGLAGGGRREGGRTDEALLDLRAGLVERAGRSLQLLYEVARGVRGVGCYGEGLDCGVVGEDEGESAEGCL